jgi:S-adenosylmethionine/arginine decarboxylase-like enzyme
MNKARCFGVELLLDLYDCDHNTINDLRLVYNFLESAVITLGVSKQSPPFVFQSPEEGFEDKAGLSGWIPLIESGIQIHTLSVKNFVSIDYYTCSEVTEQIVDNLISLAQNTFRSKKIESQFIMRGKDYYA